jgi:hypothetical protein
MVVARFLDRVCFRIGTWPIDDCFRWMRRGGTAWRGEGHVAVRSLFWGFFCMWSACSGGADVADILSVFSREEEHTCGILPCALFW